jgi:hypothetical protein
MAEINLAQEEADKLMTMEKRAIDQREWLFPGPAERIVVPLTSLDKRENFWLDITRYRIKLTKGTFQNAPAWPSSFIGLILTERRMKTRTARRFPALTCIFIVKGTATNRQSRHPQTGSPTQQTYFRRSMPSWSTATSPNCRKSRRAYSHDHNTGDRAPSERLSHMASR